MLCVLIDFFLCISVYILVFRYYGLLAGFQDYSAIPKFSVVVISYLSSFDLIMYL